MIFKSEGSTTDLNGFLDVGSHVEGDLRFEHRFRIDGKVTGRIVSEGTLEVGETGHLKGEISAREILILGKVEGEIKASQRVQIATSGKVLADIETPTLVIEDGALFEGRCVMASRGNQGRGDKQGPKPLAEAVPFSKDR